jgi:hypothetical protein
MSEPPMMMPPDFGPEYGQYSGNQRPRSNYGNRSGGQYGGQSGNRGGQSRYRDQRPPGAPMPPRRRQRFQPFDIQLLGFVLKMDRFEPLLSAAIEQVPEKNTLSDFFSDTELRQWLGQILSQPAGKSQLKTAPDTLDTSTISQELQSVIMEALLQDGASLEEAQLELLLKKGIHKIWVQFSHELKRQMTQADASQDMEKFKELSQQFLDLQRKLKDFEGSYVSGN